MSMKEKREFSDDSEAVRTYHFDGDEEKFRGWRWKIERMAHLKNCWQAFEEDLGQLLTSSEYNEAIREKDEAKKTELEPMIAKTVMERRAQVILSSGLQGSALKTVQLCKTVHEMWKNLIERYEPAGVELSYGDIETEYNACKLEIGEDPDDFFHKIEFLNLRLEEISPKYKRDELTLKLHIMDRLPKQYDSIRKKYRNELETTNLDRIKREIRQEYREMKKNSDTTLSVSTDKFKKFQGACYNCGKKGHRSSDCRLPKKNTNGQDGKHTGKSKDMTKVLCYKCKQKGHYAVTCPLKNKNNRDDEDDEAQVVFACEDAIEPFRSMKNVISIEERSGDEVKLPLKIPLKWYSDSDSDDDDDDEKNLIQRIPTKKNGSEPVIISPRGGNENEKLDDIAEYCDDCCEASDDGSINAKFLLDSGSTCHVTTNPNGISKTNTSVNNSVNVANGTACEVIFVGNITLCVVDEHSERTEYVLRDVRYIPTFKHNIISMRRLLIDGFKLLEADAKRVKFKNENGITLVFECKNDDNLYYLRNSTTKVNVHETHTATDGAATRKVSWDEAHRLLGHADTTRTREAAKQMNWVLTGLITPCEACARAKARAKGVQKTPSKPATKPGERLGIDISGPYEKSIGGNVYWIHIIDEFTRRRWSRFAKNKNDIGRKLRPLLEYMKGRNYEVKYIRCDGGGENVSVTEGVRGLCNERGINFEPVDTPKMNGKVERSFATIRDRSHAMMLDARVIGRSGASKFWTYCVKTSDQLDNMQPRLFDENRKNAYEMWNEKNPVKSTDLKEWGRIAYVTNPKGRFHKKFTDKSRKCIFIGYAEDYPSDTYEFYVPETDRVIVSRNAYKWLDWHGKGDPINGLNEIIQPLNVKSYTEATKTNLKSVPEGDENIYDEIRDVQFGRESDIEGEKQTVTEPETETEPEIHHKEDDRMSRVERELRKLNTSYNPTSTSDIDIEEIANLAADFVAVTSIMSDPDTPSSDIEAIKSKDWPKWKQGLWKEFDQFTKRKAWTQIKRKDLPDGQRVLRTKNVYKRKVNPIDPNKTIYKLRNVVLGYEQIPGVDYSESFAAVATDGSIRIVFGIHMWMEQLHENWNIEAIDVEAAFLEGELDVEMYVEIPSLYDEYCKERGMPIDPENEVLRLNMCQYGCVQAAHQWYEKFRKILEEAELYPTKSDPAVFCKRDETGKLLLLIVIYVDDCVMAGLRNEIIIAKKIIKQHVNITELGKPKRHLGVDYREKEDEHGKYWECSMEMFVNNMVKRYEEETKRKIRNFQTPGYPNVVLMKNENEPVERSLYRSFVGKLLFGTKKAIPDCSNAARELSGHLESPGEEQWKSLDRVMGYLKFNYKPIKMRRPMKLQVIQCTDSDWGTDKNDRKSITGIITTLGGNFLTNWQSKKQTGVALSSTEAETVANSTGGTDILFTEQLIDECTDARIKMSIMYGDNAGAIFIANNNAVSQRTKHIDIRHKFLNELIKQGKLEVRSVRSEDNRSDILTKNTKEGLHTKHANAMYEGLEIVQTTNGEGVKIYDEPGLDESLVTTSVPITEEHYEHWESNYYGDDQSIGWTLVKRHKLRYQKKPVKVEACKNWYKGRGSVDRERKREKITKG